MPKRSFMVLEKPPIEESYDYAEQVRRQIERCLEASAIQDKEMREGTYSACVLALEHLVPLDDRDQKFNDELEACMFEKEEDIRPKFGGITIDHETCLEMGIPTSFKEIVTDWGKYFTVLFNKFIELKVTVRRGSYNA